MDLLVLRLFPNCGISFPVEVVEPLVVIDAVIPGSMENDSIPESLRIENNHHIKITPTKSVQTFNQLTIYMYYHLKVYQCASYPAPFSRFLYIY